MVLHRTDKKQLLLIFFFFYAINIISSGGHIDNWDGWETFFVTESMVLKGSAQFHPDVPTIERANFPINYTLSINRDIQKAGGAPLANASYLEPIYLPRSIFMSAVGVPSYYLSLALHVDPLIANAFLVNPLIISLTSVVIFAFSLQLHRSAKIAFILSLIFGVCSFVWPYNSTNFPQPLQTLCLVAAAFFVFMSQHHIHSSFLCHFTQDKSSNLTRMLFAALGSLFLGLSVLSHPSSIIYTPAFVVYAIYSLRRNKDVLSYFLVTLGIMAILIGTLNYLRFGSFTAFGYGHFESLNAHTGIDGLVGLFISPGSGIIPFFPLVILAPFGFMYMYRYNKTLTLLSIYVFISTWLFAGTLSLSNGSMGWNGGAWGPRYLLTTLPFLTLSIGYLLLTFKEKMSWRKLTIVILSILGFGINLTGVLVWYLFAYLFGWWQEDLTDPSWFETFTWNPYYSVPVLVLKTLVSGYVSTLTNLPTEGPFSWLLALNYGLAPCPYDLYIFCEHGIESLLLACLILGFLTVIIMFRMGFIRTPSQRLKAFMAEKLTK